MKVFVSIGDEMMETVMRRPPERPFLVGRRSSEGNQKLKDSTGAVSAMRQQAMEAGSDRKHAHDIQRQAGTDCHPAHPCPDDQQTSQMHEKELQAAGVIQFIVIDRATVID